MSAFSDRSSFLLHENALARREAGLDGNFIDLTETNPTRVGLSEAVALPVAAEHAPEPFGLRSARDAVCGWLGASEVFLSASTSETYGWLFKLLCDPGDEVLVPRPGYPLLDSLAQLENVALRDYPLRFAGDWSIDLAALEAAATPRTRAIAVVSPANPTGQLLREHEWQALQSLCTSRGWALILDEVFAAPEQSFARREAAALTFCLGGLSKACGQPQLKLAWCAVAGSRTRECLARLEPIADTYLSVATPVQLALPQLLNTSAAFRARVAERIRRNRAALQLPADWTLLPSEAGWMGVVRIPASPSEEDVCLRLLERGVKVHPGHFYDFTGGQQLVLSLLVEPRLFAEGIRRLGE